MIEAKLLFMLVISFFGVYLNVWFLLLYFENKSKIRYTPPIKRYPSISIIVPAYNEAKHIGNCLKSILNLDYPKNKLDVTVVVNATTDGTQDIVKGFNRVKLIDLKKAGKANALNVGINQAKGELVGVLDADSFVYQDCLKKMVGYFADPKIAATTTYIKTPKPKGFWGKIQNIEYVTGGLFKKIASFVDSLYIVPGTMSLIRKDIVKEIGFTDETLTEDIDLTFSMIKKGYKIVTCLDAKVETDIPPNLRGLIKQRVRWYRGFLENTVKHRGVLFNRKYPHLGSFVIPFVCYFGIVVQLAMVSFLLINVAVSNFLLLKTSLYIPIQTQLAMQIQGATNLYNYLMTPYYLIGFGAAFIISIYTLKIVFAEMKEKLGTKQNIILIPFYIVGYYLLIITFWILSIFFEVFKRKRSW